MFEAPGSCIVPDEWEQQKSLDAGLEMAFEITPI